MKRTGVDVMKKLEQLYEGKAKKVFATEDPDVVIVDYKDDATAFNGEKKGTIVGKGVINNRMTNYVFQVLEKEGVPTHYVEELSDREKRIHRRRASLLGACACNLLQNMGVRCGQLCRRQRLNTVYMGEGQSGK